MELVKISGEKTIRISKDSKMRPVVITLCERQDKEIDNIVQKDTYKYLQMMSYAE